MNDVTGQLAAARTAIRSGQRSGVLAVKIGGQWVGRPWDLQFVMKTLDVENPVGPSPGGLRLVFDEKYLGEVPAVLFLADLAEVLIDGSKVSFTAGRGYFSFPHLDRIWLTPTMVEVLWA